jgi:protoporphyrinogen oxidase
MTAPCRVAILGAGPSGVGAAYQLARTGRGAATVLERAPVVGGLAGSFELAGLRVDFGSHRLHPACAPEILSDIRALLGADLLDRPRHGRIRLRGRWIHFPLKPLDLALRLPPGFALGTAGDLVARALPARTSAGGEESFATVLHRGLGRTICRDFYFPYARKIWGLEPEALSATQARRRVKAGSLGKMASKILSAVPGMKPRGFGRFYYPRRGYGEITERFHEAARDLGARFEFGAGVETVELLSTGGGRVHFRRGERAETLDADYVWSTIPLTVLVKSLRPAAPPDVLAATEGIRYRSMILVYLVVGQERFSEFDAHYFPGAEIPFTRVSEPRNYSLAAQPRDRTVLCAELPCAAGDAHWSMSDAALGGLLQGTLARIGLPLKANVEQVVTRRLSQAYPIYERGYEARFDTIDRWLGTLPGVLTLGRQGLFAHDNTHHTLAMAYAAVSCLDGRGEFDRAKWAGYREVFETHVVED